jgi:hypothetical protein
VSRHHLLKLILVASMLLQATIPIALLVSLADQPSITLSPNHTGQHSIVFLTGLWYDEISYRRKP